MFVIQVKNQNPDLKFVEIGKIIGQQWRMLSEEERSEYTEEYETEKVDYERKMAAYKNTPQFQVRNSRHLLTITIVKTIE